MSNVVELPVRGIKVDQDVQSRAALAEWYVDELMEVDAANLPPITVFQDGGDYWLADGFHRYERTLRCGEKTIRCDVKTGTRRDAMYFNLGSNGKHGLKRSNADLRKAIERMIKDPEWSKLTNTKIAEHLNTSPQVVGGYRPRKVGEVIEIVRAPYQRTYKNGKTIQVKGSVVKQLIGDHGAGKKPLLLVRDQRRTALQRHFINAVGAAQNIIDAASDKSDEYECSEMIRQAIVDAKQIKHRMEHYSKQLQCLIDKDAAAEPADATEQVA